MASKSPQLPQGVTPEDLKKLVAKHGKGKVFPVRVKAHNGKTYCAIVKKPTLEIIDLATSVSRDAQGIDPTKFNDFVWKNCKLACDPEIESDDELFSGARSMATSLFKAAQAEVGEAFA